VGALRDGYPSVAVGAVSRAMVPGSRKHERAPRVVRLDVSTRMPFYVARLRFEV